MQIEITDHVKSIFEKHCYPEPNTGCWLWGGGAYGKFGYGAITLGRKSLNNVRKAYAHRVSFMIAYGVIPHRLCVLHKCDTPSCVNPDHLYVGTREQNVEDIVKRGRHAHGVDRLNAKLTPDAVREIRSRAISVRGAMNKYCVSRSTVKDVRAGRTWKRTE